MMALMMGTVPTIITMIATGRPAVQPNADDDDQRDGDAGTDYPPGAAGLISPGVGPAVLNSQRCVFFGWQAPCVKRVGGVTIGPLAQGGRIAAAAIERSKWSQFWNTT
jgi:hypothetical protein